MLGRSRAIFRLVAKATPVIETVGARRIVRLVSQRITIGKLGLLTLLDWHSIALARGLTLTFPHGHRRSIAIRIHIETVVACPRNSES